MAGHDILQGDKQRMTEAQRARLVRRRHGNREMLLTAAGISRKHPTLLPERVDVILVLTGLIDLR